MLTCGKIAEIKATIITAVMKMRNYEAKRVKLQAPCQTCNCMQFVLLPPGVTPGAPAAILMASRDIPYQIRATVSTYMNSNHSQHTYLETSIHNGQSDKIIESQS
jgi:hypothetical protein